MTFAHFFSGFGFEYNYCGSNGLSVAYGSGPQPIEVHGPGLWEKNFPRPSRDSHQGLWNELCRHGRAPRSWDELHTCSPAYSCTFAVYSVNCTCSVNSPALSCTYHLGLGWDRVPPELLPPVQSPVAKAPQTELWTGG